MAERSESLKLIISGDGKLLGAELGRSEGRVKQYESRITGMFSTMGNKISSSIKSMVTNPLAMLGGSAAILYAGKQIMDYDASLTRLGIKSGMTAKEQMKLRQEIDNVAMATGQSHGDILSGLDKLRSETGDLGVARDLMQDIAIASGATGASMESLGGLAGSLTEKLHLSKEEIKASMNLIIAQGHQKGFSLEGLAENSERIFAAASRFNMSGMGDLRKFTAFLSTAKESLGSESKAMPGVEGILSVLEQRNGAFGFKFTDEQGNLKDIETILKGVIKAADGSQKKLDKLFGARGGRALAEMAKEYRQSGTFEVFDTFKNADTGKQGQMMQDFSRYTETAQYQMKLLSNAAWSFADAGLSPIIKDMATQLKMMTSDPAKMEQFKKSLSEIAALMGGLSKAALTVGGIFAKVWNFDPSHGGTSWNPLLNWFFGESDNKKGNANPQSIAHGPTSFNMLDYANKSARAGTTQVQVNPIFNFKTQYNPGLVTLDSTDLDSKSVVNTDRGSLK